MPDLDLSDNKIHPNQEELLRNQLPRHIHHLEERQQHELDHNREDVDVLNGAPHVRALPDQDLFLHLERREDFLLVRELWKDEVDLVFLHLVAIDLGLG